MTDGNDLIKLDESTFYLRGWVFKFPRCENSEHSMARRRCGEEFEISKILKFQISLVCSL
jgi:hypothetical protein